MSITKKLAIAAFTIALSACGSDGGNNSPAESSQKERFPIPEISQNRPKTGIGAVVNVPWLITESASDDDGLVYRPYFYFTGETVSLTTLCGIVEDGERKWIKPTATSRVLWKDGSVEVLEDTEAEEIIGNWKCTAGTRAVEFNYRVLDNGETLELSAFGDSVKLSAFRN